MNHQRNGFSNEIYPSIKKTSHEILAFNNYLDRMRQENSYRHKIFKSELTEEIEFQHKFQNAVTDILKKFIKIEMDNIDEVMSFILKKLGNSCQVDRCYVHQFYDKDRFIKNNFIWTGTQIELDNEILNVFLKEIKPYWIQRLYQEEYLIVNSIKERNRFLKEERVLIDQQDIKSLLILPMQVEKDLFGFFGFDFITKSHNFRDYEIRSLKLLTEIVSGLFAKNLDYAKIKYYSFRDNLTGLYNRAFISEEIKRLDTKRQLPISIIMIDINNLKLYNDSFGHQKGDELIVKTAQILKSTFRSEDIVARWGGDEFIIFLPKTDQKTALKIIARLEERCKETHDKNLPVSLSIGLAMKTKSKEKINKIINQADQNMYADKIKKRKKSKSIFFTRVLVNMTKNIVGKFLAVAFLLLLV